MTDIERLCTICARGGSKGVPGKNIRPIAGKPLLAHSIWQAKETGLFSSIAVSSDSAEILDVAARYGADQLIERPADLATDHSPKLPVIRHCASLVEQRLGKRFAGFVDLDATSPLRSVQDIVACVELHRSQSADIVLTAAPARRSPYFNMVSIGPDQGVDILMRLDPPPARRQDAPAVFDMNASIYVWTREALMDGRGLFGSRTRLHVMPEERSIDIDSELDWLIVRSLMERDVEAG